ncbi:MAG: hypothetical protein V1728_01790 [Candidatus Micrarchaeota archaeon]
MMQQKTAQERLTDEDQAREQRKDRLRQEFWSQGFVPATIRLTNAYRDIKAVGATQEPGVLINGEAAQSQPVHSSCSISVEMPIPPELSVPGEKERLKEQMLAYLSQTNAHATVIETTNGFFIQEDVFLEGLKNAPVWHVPLQQEIAEIAPQTSERLMVEGIEYASHAAKETLREAGGIPAPIRQDVPDLLTMKLGEENFAAEKPAENLFAQAKKAFSDLLAAMEKENGLDPMETRLAVAGYENGLDRTQLVLSHPQSGHEEKKQALGRMLAQAAKTFGIAEKNQKLIETRPNEKSGFYLVPEKSDRKTSLA